MLAFGMSLLMRGLLPTPILLALPDLPDRPAFALPIGPSHAIGESLPRFPIIQVLFAF